MSKVKRVFKPRVERKYIGSYSPRTDALKKASGKAVFTDDMTLARKYPDMLYMRMLKSPYPHAKIKSIDSSEAEALPGVVAVLRYDDPEVLALPWISCSYSDAVGTWTKDQAWTHMDRRILGDHAHWVGDELGCAVAATSQETAEEAIKLLKVEWEVLPFVLNVEDALKPDAPILHPEINPDSNLIPEIEGYTWGKDIFVDNGDVEKGLEEAEIVVETQTNFYNAQQCALEYWSGMIDWKEEENEMTVLSDSYAVDQTRYSMHDIFKVPLSNIRVITPYQGGQHGRADTGEQIFYFVCAILSRRTGRPVKYRQTRKEHFHDCRNTQLLKVRLGATKEGKITACHITSIANEGAYLDLGAGDPKISVDVWAESTPDAIPNLRVEGKCIYTNIIPSSCMRSVGNVGMNFILGLGIDELAEKLEMDPADIYRKSLGWRKAPDKNLETVMDEGLAAIGWENRHKAGEGPLIDGTKKRGLGFCVGDTWHTEHYEYRRGSTEIMIKLNPDGTVILDAPTVEVGTGTNHCAVLACAESLGVAPEKIKWIYRQDTDTGLKDQVQSDSSVSYILGEATYACGKLLKEKFLNMISKKIGYPPESLDMMDGCVYVKSRPEVRMTIEEYYHNIDLSEESNLNPVVQYYERPISQVNDGVAFMGAFAEVEVDIETGEVTVPKLVVASDGGTILYASGAEGQLVGGQCMGIGESLFEKMIYDENTGIPLNFNFVDYKFPTIEDFPDVDPMPMEVYKGTAGEFGCCGIGEGAPCCTPRAISNAIYNAIGVRVDGTAISPMDILNALGKVGE